MFPCHLTKTVESCNITFLTLVMENHYNIYIYSYLILYNNNIIYICKHSFQFAYQHTDTRSNWNWTAELQPTACLFSFGGGRLKPTTNQRICKKWTGKIDGQPSELRIEEISSSQKQESSVSGVLAAVASNCFGLNIWGVLKIGGSPSHDRFQY